MDYKAEYERLVELRDSEEWQRRRDEERAYQEREERRHQMRKEAEESQCHANGWGDAFAKTLPRLRYEALDETPENNEPFSHDYFFTKQVEEHEVARDALKEESVAVQDRIRRIRERAERMIEALEQQARNKAADRVDQQFGRETIIGESLRNNDYESVVNW